MDAKNTNFSHFLTHFRYQSNHRWTQSWLSVYIYPVVYIENMKQENIVTIFQTKKKSKLVALPKQKVEKELGWITGDKLEYEVRDNELVLRKKARQ